MRVMVVGQPSLFRQGVSLLLAGLPAVRQVAVAAAIDASAAAGADAVVVVCPSPDALHAVGPVAEAAVRSSRVIALVAAGEEPVPAGSAGVDAVLGWGDAADLLGRVLTGATVDRIDPGRPHHPLSPREIEVLDLVASGTSTRRIAEVLQISAKTVENHKHRIFAKLGVQNQAHAVAVALREGLLGGRPPIETVPPEAASEPAAAERCLV